MLSQMQGTALLPWSTPKIRAERVDVKNPEEAPSAVHIKNFIPGIVASMHAEAVGCIPSGPVAMRPMEGMILSKQALASLLKIMALRQVYLM